MGKEKDTYKIFSTTGCLTEVGLSRYTKHLLSKSELLLAVEHIKSCNLCSDAIDGYKAFNNIDLFAENTKVLKKKIKSRHRKSNRNRIFYYSAAASLLIVIMTSVLYHQTSGKLNIEDKEFTLNDPKTEIATYAKENIAMNMAAKLDDTEKKIRSKNGGITNPKVAAPIVSASKEIETKKVVDVISEKASVNTSIEEPLESIVYEDKKELQEEAEEKVLAKKADGARAAADKAYPSSDELESVGYSSRKRASAPIKNKAVYSLTYTRFEDYIYSKMSHD